MCGLSYTKLSTHLDIFICLQMFTKVTGTTAQIITFHMAVNVCNINLVTNSTHVCNDMQPKNRDFVGFTLRWYMMTSMCENNLYLPQTG